jgi:hypothetical protein
VKVVAVFVYRHQAEHAVGYLSREGVPAFVQADDAGGLHPGLGFSRSARVIVADTDADRAREVLQDAGLLTADDG